MTITTQEELDIYTVGVEVQRLEVVRVEKVMRNGIAMLDEQIDGVLTDLADSPS